MKERLELHNVHTDHITIQSELQYLIATKVVGTIKLEFQPGQKPNILCPVWDTTCKDKVGRVFTRVWNRTELIFRSKPGLLEGYLDPFLTLYRRYMVNQILIYTVCIIVINAGV